VDLLDNYKQALVLNSMIEAMNEKLKYKEYNNFILEEQLRENQKLELKEVKKGWFELSMQELTEKILITKRPSTAAKYLRSLTKKNYILKRKTNKYNHYRLNLVKLKADLNQIGYYLENFHHNLLIGG
jgi:predicted nuclease with TOPRIM domain